MQFPQACVPNNYICLEGARTRLDYLSLNFVNYTYKFYDVTIVVKYTEIHLEPYKDCNYDYIYLIFIFVTLLLFINPPIRINL